MKQYILRRLLQMIPTLLGTTFIVFIIINMAPGSPLSHMVDPTISGEALERRREQLGLDRPILQRYGLWIAEAVQGNLGYSTRYRGRLVTDLIQSRLAATITLTFSSILVSFILAVPIGVISATRQYSTLDYTVVVSAIAGVSVPVFFLGIVLIWAFGFQLGWFPVGGMATAGVSHPTFMAYISDVARHLVLPLVTLTAASTARFVRFTRSSMLEVIRQDYVRTARAKGLSEQVVIYRHALRNALLPVVTILGLSLPFLFSGAIITEAVFAWPGMGTLLIESVSQRDYGLLMGINLFLAILVIFGNLLADVFYTVVDPRIRYD